MKSAPDLSISVFLTRSCQAFFFFFFLCGMGFGGLGRCSRLGSGGWGRDPTVIVKQVLPTTEMNPPYECFHLSVFHWVRNFRSILQRKKWRLVERRPKVTQLVRISLYCPSVGPPARVRFELNGEE